MSKYSVIIPIKLESTTYDSLSLYLKILLNFLLKNMKSLLKIESRLKITDNYEVEVFHVMSHITMEGM